jgi:hypothetical protein
VSRPLRITLLAVVGLAVLLLAALGASAVLDRPAKVVTVRTTVDGPKRDVWAALVGLSVYPEWNPVVTSASGELREGGKLDLEFVLPGHDPDKLEATILAYRPTRKLGWQARLLLPGVRDWEYGIVLEPLEDGHVLVKQLLRIEGLLAPFADTGAVREALELQGRALADRMSAQR